MADSPKISRVTIGLPVFNGAETLDESLKALTSQDCQDLVILVSDNASTDETPEILEKWASRDSRITVFRQPENIGAAKNFDWVRSKASTEWFMFGAHDDDWSPNYVSALLECADKSPGCQLAVPKVVFSFPDGRTPIERSLDESIFQLDGIEKTKALLRSAHGSWIYGLYRREALLEAFEASSSYPHTWGFDLLLLLPNLLRGDLAGSNQAVFTHLETTVTRERYRPATSSDQFVLGRDFRRTAFKILRKEVSSQVDYFRLFFPVLRYADRHGFKLRRAVKNRIKETFSRKPRT